MGVCTAVVVHSIDGWYSVSQKLRSRYFLLRAFEAICRVHAHPFWLNLLVKSLDNEEQMPYW